MNYIQTTSMMSQVIQPPVSSISRDIVSQNDTDSDSSLSIDELGISEELFSALDTDGDSLVTSNEIASAIESKLSSFEGSVPTKEEFESLISELGLEMPEPPSPSDAMTADLISTYDTDGDSLLSSDEVTMLTEEEFAALDTDSDGSISAEELSSAIEQVASSGTPPPAQGGAPAGGEGGSASSEEEEYDEADTNQDGIVSYEEKMAALGIDTSSQETASTQESSIDYESLQNGVKLLMDTIKHNAQDSDNIELSNFKSIMKMMNTQSNNSDLNTYVQNLGASTALNAQKYA